MSPVSGKHLSQVVQQLPAEKLAAKKLKTILGAALVAIGSVAALGAFVIAILLVQGGMAIDKWSVILAGLPLLAGLFLVIVGAHVASGELVSAALKDVRATLRIWKRTGNGGGA